MKEKWNCTPRVYVGTYKKYNEGSLRGGWITLTDYPSYDAFMEACFKLHKDERDPELMIQDCEDMPDGLSPREWLYEEDFNDIIEAVAAESVPEDAPKFRIIDYSDKAIAVVGDTRDIKDKLKELGGRFNPRLSCGAGWVFSKKAKAEVEKLLQCGSVEVVEKPTPKPKAKKNEAMEEAKAEYVKVWKDDERMVKHCQGEISNAVKLSDGRIVIVKKEKLETSFCFGYSTCGQGSEYEEANDEARNARTNEDYFREQNLKEYNLAIALLKGEKEHSWGKDAYLEQLNCRTCGLINIHEVVGLHYCDFVEQRYGTYSELSEADKELIIAMYEEEKEKMNKRIDAYLKRYGLSKLNVWTYWLDA